MARNVNSRKCDPFYIKNNIFKQDKSLSFLSRLVSPFSVLSLVTGYLGLVLESRPKQSEKLKLLKSKYFAIKKKKRKKVTKQSLTLSILTTLHVN